MEKLNLFYRMALLVSCVFVSGMMSAESVMTESTGEESDYVPMIREDRVWEYVRPLSVEYDPDIAIWRMKFEGTEERFGRIYHRFVPIGGEEYRRLDNSREFMVVENRYPDEYALLREEDGKVFVVNNRYGDEECDFDDADISSEELLIYDFTHDVGSVMPVVYTQPAFAVAYGDIYQYHSSVEVKYIERRMIEGESCRVVGLGMTPESSENLDIYGGYSYTEGIGATHRGTLYQLEMGSLANGNTILTDLNNVYDLSGNVIFAGVGHTRESLLGNDPGSVETPVVEPGGAVFFNLQGQPVANPERGGVYIRRDGTKICKIRLK